MKKKQIIWSQDAGDDLCEIIAYIRDTTGKKTAREIYCRIIEHVEKIVIFPESGRIIPELLSMGIVDIREVRFSVSLTEEEMSGTYCIKK